MLSYISDYVKTSDDITKPSHTRLNYNGDIKQKTLLGGFLSICVSLYVTWIAISKGTQMVQLDGPKIDS